MTHTPTPWTQYMHGPMIHNPDGFYIGIMQGNNAARDAAFIVRACNSHDKLVSALRRIAEGNLGDEPWQANYGVIRLVAKEALEGLE